MWTGVGSWAFESLAGPKPTNNQMELAEQTAGKQKVKHWQSATLWIAILLKFSWESELRLLSVASGHAGDVTANRCWIHTRVIGCKQ